MGGVVGRELALTGGEEEAGLVKHDLEQIEAHAGLHHGDSDALVRRPYGRCETELFPPAMKHAALALLLNTVRLLRGAGWCMG